MNTHLLTLRAAGLAALLGLGGFALADEQAAASPASPQAQAALPSVQDVVARMNKALTPDKTVLERISLTAETEDKVVTRYPAVMARRGTEDGTQTTLMLLDGSEPGARNVVMAWGSKRDGKPIEAIYLPEEGRVREIEPVLTDSKLLRTDFTRGDLGLSARAVQSQRLLGKDSVSHREALKLETVFKDSPYYSRMVTWVSPTTWLPLRREYFDRADRLWRVERFSGLVIDGEPTLTRIAIDDVQSGTNSALVVEEVRFDDRPLESLFRTSSLNTVPQNAVWTDLAPPTL